MSTYTNNGFRGWNASGSGLTTTGLRNYLSDTKDGLVGSGWAVSSDTGQVDVATVTAPAGAGAIGYQMFYLNDSQHSTYPIFMKRVYSVGVATSRLIVQLGFGVATDGAGTFVGTPLWSLTTLNNGSTSCVPEVTTAPFWGSYGEGYSTTLEGVSHYASASVPRTIIVSVSREYDQITGLPGTTGNFSTFFSQITTLPYPSNGWSVGYNRSFNREYAFNINGTSIHHTHVPMQAGFAGSQVELYPMYHRSRNAWISPAICSYRLADITIDNTVTTDMLGVSHTYRATGLLHQTSSSQSHGLAILWE